MKTIGVDIGGTQLRCAIFDEEGVMVKKIKVSNERSKTPEENLLPILDFIKGNNFSYRGIGIGCPGPINIRLGKILNPPNLERWRNFEIVKFFEENTSLKSLLNNDANLAGLAEARLGAGKGYESVFYLTVSTGIGGAYILRGDIICGANSTAAEVYNLIVNEDTYTHNGVNSGAINEQCSGTALSRIASNFYKVPLTTKELFDYYYAGDSKAIDIIQTAAENLGKAIGNISCVVDPDIFVIGGSVAFNNPDFVHLIKESALKYVIFPAQLQISVA